MIPPFNSDGNLPSGIHKVSWQEFSLRFGQNSQRAFLIQGLVKLMNNLRGAGCGRILIDGSFTTDKEVPNDYDLCWDVVGVNPARLDPILLNFSDIGRLLQKRSYRGDIFPAQLTEGSSGLAFVNFFQVDKSTGNKKGIIEILL